MDGIINILINVNIPMLKLNMSIYKVKVVVFVGLVEYYRLKQI